jgi:hypothetical protein
MDSIFNWSSYKSNGLHRSALKDGFETPFAFMYLVGRAAHHFLARFLPFNIASACFFCFKRRYKFPKDSTSR